MTEQEKFLAVQTAAEARKFIGRKVLSTDSGFTGLREIIGWAPKGADVSSRGHDSGSFTLEWLTYAEDKGWPGEWGDKDRMEVGKAREGSGNRWINRSMLFLATEEEWEADRKEKHMKIQKEYMKQIKEVDRSINELEIMRNSIIDKLDKEPVEVKPAIRHLDLDD